MLLAYSCTNDDCPLVGKRIMLGSEADATCPECGWFMSALYEDGDPDYGSEA